MQLIKQSQAYTFRIGPFRDATDGITYESGLTITQANVRLSKHGGDFAQMNAAASPDALVHDEKGYYILPLDATDTNTVGNLRVAVDVVTGSPETPVHLSVWDDLVVFPSNVYDSLIGGTDLLDINVSQISESTDAADNLEEGAKAIVTGQAQTGTLTTTSMTTNLGVNYSSNTLAGAVVVFDGNVTAAIKGVRRTISSYTSSGSPLVGTVNWSSAIPSAPANGDTFQIV